MKTLTTMAVMWILMAFAITLTAGKPVHNKRTKRADRNKDGQVSRKEARRAWHYRKFKVNTKLEKKFDSDGNGVITKDEAKAYLAAKRALIKTNGKAKVNSEIEKEYDTNGDGIITKDEAEAMPGK